MTVGHNMASLPLLDVGCGIGIGIGSMLRQVDPGAAPARLTGTELLPGRLEAARSHAVCLEAFVG